MIYGEVGNLIISPLMESVLFQQMQGIDYYMDLKGGKWVNDIIVKFLFLVVEHRMFCLESSVIVLTEKLHSPSTETVYMCIEENLAF